MLILYLPGVHERVVQSILPLRFRKFRFGVLLSGKLITSFPRDVPILIDNKAYEGETLSLSEVLRLYQQAIKHYNFVKFVIPDFIEDLTKTIIMYEEALRYIVKNLDKSILRNCIFVLQGKTIDEYKLCFKALVKTFNKFKTCGVSIKEITIGIGGVKKKKLHERWIYVTEIVKFVRNYFKHVHGVSPVVHVFGGDLLTIEKTWRFVNSFDFTTPFHRFGLYGIAVTTITPNYTVRDFKIMARENEINYEILMFHNLYITLQILEKRMK